ncbi:stage III sporulation protein AA [Clostridium oryzae]|nr:stage III sporulation protein AA [Clostridium oryzae]
MYTDEIYSILSDNIRNYIKRVNNLDKLQEIRIRAGKPLILNVADKELILDYIVSIEDLRIVIQRISNYSIYAYEEEIKQGFITINGGHRVGLCGKFVIENNKVKTLKNAASINIRISREVKGCSDRVIPYILNHGNICNTIIISPPKCGKTTILRDISRNISNGINTINLAGKKVCVIDERSEIAACCNGIPQLEVGLRTDVMDNCPKSEGIMMAIRSMSPEVIICDEIGTHADMESILSALSCGVNLITTMHGDSLQDLYSRLVFKDIINNHVFKRAVIMSNKRGVGTIEGVYDFSNDKFIWGNGND